MRPTRPYLRAILLSVALAAALVSLTVLGGCGPSVPSVDDLIKHYEAHRADFATLARLTARDPNFALWREDPGPDDERYGLPSPLSADQKERYRKLLLDVGGEHLGAGQGEAEVTMGSWGLAVSGVAWGYIHCDEPPSPLMTLDEARDGGNADGWTCPLGDGWYAYVDRS